MPMTGPAAGPDRCGEREGAVVTVTRQSSEVKTPGGVKPRVLLVEDDPAITKMLKAYLEREGYVTAAAGTVSDMRAAVEADRVDLVLLDVMLPDEDGSSALRWL